MYHNRIVAVKVFFIPNLFKNLLGGNYLAGIFAKKPENIKFGRGKRNLLFIKGANVGLMINYQARQNRKFLCFPMFLRRYKEYIA